MARKKIRSIGILTSGGDCQGLNAAIRAVAKTAMKSFGMDVVGIRGQTPVHVELSQVAGKCRNVPPDHPWIQTLRRLNICLGD